MNPEERIQTIVDLMRRDLSVDAPTDAVKWAKGLYLSSERQPSMVRRIIALLQADLLPNRAVAGERSGSAAQVRQMFFTADQNAIDLRVTSGLKGESIQGQILGSGFEKASVKLIGGKKTYETGTGETGIFELTDVPTGDYSLLVTGDQCEIVVNDIRL